MQCTLRSVLHMYGMHVVTHLGQWSHMQQSPVQVNQTPSLVQDFDLWHAAKIGANCLLLQVLLTTWATCNNLGHLTFWKEKSQTRDILLISKTGLQSDQTESVNMSSKLSVVTPQFTRQGKHRSIWENSRYICMRASPWLTPQPRLSMVTINTWPKSDD